MWPYWFLFAMPVWLAVNKLQTVEVNRSAWPNLWIGYFVLLVTMVGLRFETGGDWGNYLHQLTIITGESFQSAVIMSREEPAYATLNWLGASMTSGIYFINTVCAVFFSWGLVAFCRAQPRPWLAMTIAVPYLVIVVAMGYTRQGVAIGFVMLGLVALTDRKRALFIVFVILAALFHRTAVILMPLAVLSSTKNKVWTAMWVGIFSIFFYYLLLQDSVQNFTTNYIQANYDSAGAAIRVAMNAVPAVLFLIFRRRFVIPKAEKIFWTWMSLGALGFVVLLIVSSSSTAVDRMALYWIPLQIYVLSRLPNALGKANGRNAVWVYSVVAYCTAVQFTWLIFANNASYWLPYQFYPWTALWN